jgi:hypothetical protein
MTSSRETTQFDDRNGLEADEAASPAVESISPAAAQEFALLPVEVDTGHRRGLSHFLTALFVHAGRAQ